MQRKHRDTPWSLKGVRPEVREMAKSAAAEAGVPIGTWLSRAIRTVGEAELRDPTKRRAPPRPDSAIERAVAPPGQPSARPPAQGGEPTSFAETDVDVQRLLDRAAGSDVGD